MLNGGAWNNCRSLLSDKKPEINIAAIELLANLSLSETVTRFTNFKLEIDALICLLKTHFSNQRLTFSVMTFFANTITEETAMEELISDKQRLSSFIGCVLRILTFKESAPNEDLWHRCLHLLDEVKEHVKLRQMVPADLSRGDIALAMSRISSEAKN